MPLLNYNAIEKKLGIRFKRRSLLKRALTHTSYLQTQQKGYETSNETLEFLGDAVLELITREYLLKKLPDAREGELSELKKMYTSTEILYKTGKKLDVGRYLLLGKGEELTGGRARPSIIAASVEAIIGALYLDRGLLYVRKFIERILFKKKIVKQQDYKSDLNKWAMRHQHRICYRVIKEEGPPHHKTFFVDLYVDGKKKDQGSGQTKKKAEQEAAKIFIKKNIK